MFKLWMFVLWNVVLCVFAQGAFVNDNVLYIRPTWSNGVDDDKVSIWTVINPKNNNQVWLHPSAKIMLDRMSLNQDMWYARLTITTYLAVPKPGTTNYEVDDLGLIISHNLLQSAINWQQNNVFGVKIFFLNYQTHPEKETWFETDPV